MIFKNVLLIKGINSIGNAGEIVKVRGGYARNFLLPNNFAIMISRKNLRYIHHRKNLINKISVMKDNKLTELSKKLQNMEITIYSDVTAKGNLFGSITSKDISKYFNNYKMRINHRQIKVKQPIKSIGRHEVDVELSANLSIKLAINVTN